MTGLLLTGQASVLVPGSFSTKAPYGAGCFLPGCRRRLNALWMPKDKSSGKFHCRAELVGPFTQGPALTRRWSGWVGAARGTISLTLSQAPGTGHGRCITSHRGNSASWEFRGTVTCALCWNGSVRGVTFVQNSGQIRESVWEYLSGRVPTEGIVSAKALG